MSDDIDAPTRITLGFVLVLAHVLVVLAMILAVWG